MTFNHMKNNPYNSQFNTDAKLLDEDTFRFDCHPGVACFTRCCKDADMYLYPYDIIRMKKRLGISSDQFLVQHTLSAFRDNPYFPSLMLKMSDNKEKSCPFLSPKGCMVYEDRPYSCRTYPLERAVARGGNENQRTALYFITNHSHCRGHKEPRKWTVKEWLKDQQVQLFNEMNDLWVDIDTLFRGNPWGSKGVDSPALKMAFMACFNVDKFKNFIFESTFLARFDLPPKKIELLAESNVELMKFGFDWTRFFLTGTGPLAGIPHEQR